MTRRAAPRPLSLLPRRVLCLQPVPTRPRASHALPCTFRRRHKRSVRPKRSLTFTLPVTFAVIGTTTRAAAFPVISRRSVTVGLSGSGHLPPAPFSPVF